MSDITVDQIVEVYIKIRDARDEARREADKIDADFESQLEVLEQQMLDVCKATGATSLKTPHGTIMQSIKKRYWTNDWESLYKFIKDNDAFHLLHRRVNQSAMKEFLEENPDKVPAGLSSLTETTVTVRKPS